MSRPVFHIPLDTFEIGSTTAGVYGSYRLTVRIIHRSAHYLTHLRKAGGWFNCDDPKDYLDEYKTGYIRDTNSVILLFERVLSTSNIS
jgi:hypothetical protein